jgi:hypothetical protein
LLQWLQLFRLFHLRLACLLVLVSELQQELLCQRALGPVQRAAGLLPSLPQPQASEVYQRVGLPRLPPPFLLPPLEWGRLPHLLPQRLQPPQQSSELGAGWHHSPHRAISE